MNKEVKVQRRNKKSFLQSQSNSWSESFLLAYEMLIWPFLPHQKILSLKSHLFGNFLKFTYFSSFSSRLSPSIEKIHSTIFHPIEQPQSLDIIKQVNKRETTKNIEDDWEKSGCWCSMNITQQQQSANNKLLKSQVAWYSIELDAKALKKKRRTISEDFSPWLVLVC